MLYANVLNSVAVRERNERGDGTIIRFIDDAGTVVKPYTQCQIAKLVESSGWIQALYQFGEPLTLDLRRLTGLRAVKLDIVISACESLMIQNVTIDVSNVTALIQRTVVLLYLSAKTILISRNLHSIFGVLKKEERKRGTSNGEIIAEIVEFLSTLACQRQLPLLSDADIEIVNHLLSLVSNEVDVQYLLTLMRSKAQPSFPYLLKTIRGLLNRDDTNLQRLATRNGKLKSDGIELENQLQKYADRLDKEKLISQEEFSARPKALTWLLRGVGNQIRTQGKVHEVLPFFRMAEETLSLLFRKLPGQPASLIIAWVSASGSHHLLIDGTEIIIYDPRCLCARLAKQVGYVIPCSCPGYTHSIHYTFSDQDILTENGGGLVVPLDQSNFDEGPLSTTDDFQISIIGRTERRLVL